jgi:hypothetical protein
MKKFLTQKIKVQYVVVIMLLLSAFVGSVQAYAPGTEIIPAFIHRGAGEQVINGILKIGNATGVIGSLDVRGSSNSLAHFMGNDDSYFTVLFPSALATIAGQVFIGENATSTGSGNILQNSSAEMQRVNVLGKVRSTGLISIPAVDGNKVCVDAAGVLDLCPTANPIIGSCGSTNGTNVPALPTSGLCATGTASTVSVGAGTYDWNCYGSGGGSTASCSANMVINGACSTTTDQCTVGTRSSPYESSGSTTDQWSCTGINGGTTASCSKNIQDSCSAPVLTQSNLTVVEDPGVTTSGPNGQFHITFDESLYERVNMYVQGPISSGSGRTNISPVKHGNFGKGLTWSISINADCKSTGERVTSNSIQSEGSSYVAPPTNTCNQVWVDGTSFSWGGIGYGYFDKNKNSAAQDSTGLYGFGMAFEDACYDGYVVQGSGVNATWHRYECVPSGAPYGLSSTITNPPTCSGSCYKYQANSGGNAPGVIYTNASGTPINPPGSNTPIYSTIGDPSDWIGQSGGNYSRYVPVASACA